MHWQESEWRLETYQFECNDADEATSGTTVQDWLLREHDPDTRVMSNAGDAGSSDRQRDAGAGPGDAGGSDRQRDAGAGLGDAGNPARPRGAGPGDAGGSARPRGAGPGDAGGSARPRGAGPGDAGGSARPRGAGPGDAGGSARPRGAGPGDAGGSARPRGAGPGDAGGSVEIANPVRRAKKGNNPAESKDKHEMSLVLRKQARNKRYRRRRAKSVIKAEPDAPPIENGQRGNGGVGGASLPGNRGSFSSLTGSSQSFISLSCSAENNSSLTKVILFLGVETSTSSQSGATNGEDRIVPKRKGVHGSGCSSTQEDSGSPLTRHTSRGLFKDATPPRPATSSTNPSLNMDLSVGNSSRVDKRKTIHCYSKCKLDPLDSSSMIRNIHPELFLYR
ncbi:circumsporozoite protein-like [Procambarus clarkii]|uniref:circumsporozoite protein-like n=1 Tax=Procambarus clarkii TaxID=6728 RepID=UPI0037434EBB